MKAFLFCIWTAIAVMAVILLSGLVVKSQNFTGSDITLTIDSTNLLTINATSPVTIETASNQFFVFRNGAETVVGVLTPKPLGWDKYEYFTTGKTEIRSGTWIVEKGSSITTHLSSSESMAVQEDLKFEEKVTVLIKVILVSLIIWGLGVLVGL